MVDSNFPTGAAAIHSSSHWLGIAHPSIVWHTLGASGHAHMRSRGLPYPRCLQTRRNADDVQAGTTSKRSLDIDTVIRCQCSRNMPEAVFVHAATHLTVHLTTPLVFGNEGDTACSLLRGLCQPTVQVLQLCFEEPDWPFAALFPALFPEPVVHPNLKIKFHFAWWASYNVIGTAKAVRSLLANHFGIDIRRVQEVISVRPFPTLPKVTCAHSPERPYSH